MVKVICILFAIIGYAVLGYFKVSAKKAEDVLIAEQRKGLK